MKKRDKVLYGETNLIGRIDIYVVSVLADIYEKR